MKNILLLIVLVFAMGSGYFIGQYRGKEARNALEKAVETGKVLDREREGAIASLRKELDSIGEKYKRDIETSRKDYETKAAEWARAKSRLDNTIEHQTKSLAALNRTLAMLEKTGASAGTEKGLAQLKTAAADLKREIDGNTCLKMPLPNSALDALGDMKLIGAEK